MNEHAEDIERWAKVINGETLTTTSVEPKPWSLADDCARLRDLARRHGFAIRSRDARDIWERRSKPARSTWLPLPETDEQLFNEMLKYLHDWLAEDDVEVKPAADFFERPGLERPQLIDENEHGPCEICAKWAAQRGQRDSQGNTIIWCEGCGLRITGMEHNGGRGVQGVVPHHYHLTQVNGSVPGRRGVHQELCLDCAIALRLKVYPPDAKDKHGNFNPTAEQMRNYAG